MRVIVTKAMPIALVLLVSLTMLAPVTLAQGSTHYVSQGDDIQAAVDSASPGDTIEFALGTYTLGATINVTKSLTLTSADPYSSSKPLLHGNYTLSRILYIDADNVTVDGLEVAHGTGDLIRQSSAYSGTAVTNCIVHDSTGDEGIQLVNCSNGLIRCNEVYDVAQDGICVSYGDTVEVANNEIYGSDSENAAIYVYNSTSIAVKGNHIHDTTAANGILYYHCYGGTHAIESNLIEGNSWQGGQRGYDEADGNSISIYKPEAACTYNTAHNTVDSNTGQDGAANPTGHAVYLNDGYPTGSGFVTYIDDNILTNHNGYGIRTYYWTSGATVTYSYSDIWQNALGATDGNPMDGGNNISADPLFNPDYTLPSGSPCAGTGSGGSDMGVVFGNCSCEPTETVSTPTAPIGPTSGEVYQTLTYSTGGAVSNLGHAVDYQFDWGDGSYSTWSTSTSAGHYWTTDDTFTVRARARCSAHTDVVSDWSTGTSVTIEVVIADDPPAPPTNLTATGHGDPRIDLTWQDNSNNELGFRIERKNRPSGYFHEIASVGANETSYSDTDIELGREYYYRVRSWNFIQGELGPTETYSDYSNTAAAIASSGGGCFVASAAYGSYLDSHVNTLRSFRDAYLEDIFVSTYYSASPAIVDIMEDNQVLKPAVRAALIPAVAAGSAATGMGAAAKLGVAATLVLAAAACGIWTRRKLAGEAPL